MSDPRETPFNGRVAHVSLRGSVEAETFTEGTVHQVCTSLSPLLRAPGGDRDREILFGQRFRVLDDTVLEGGVAYVFGFAEVDGYCGWVAARDLSETEELTHFVAVRETYAKPTADLKTTEGILPLFLGSPVTLHGTSGEWAQIGFGHIHVPLRHLRPVEDLFTDPADVARLFLGTPYLWGGNSGRGIDCSGLVQAAMLACGILCPGDSDQQEARLGDEVPVDADRRRGDLYFWKGHVGMLVDRDILIHANAHHMMVAEEPLSDAVARIEATENKPITSRRRVSRPDV